MEVEVKLRLPDAAAHQLLSDALTSSHRCTLLQENIFFDGPSGELSAAFAALRLRFYGSDSRCVLSLKSRPVLSAGISRVEEIEEDIDPSIGRACVAEPWRLTALASSSNIMKKVVQEYRLGGEEKNSLTCLGGFKNVRAVYDWKEGLVLELDETSFSFGTVYEVECETTDPERTKVLLEGFLKEVGVPYVYSQSNKFGLFRAGKLLP
ncbi:Triphosphate tunel metalloenzyme 3 [Rhynchospora pubera]|uniref:Triphosphate tunel metalloenzyme 3 n=1 Tax=Rhynchospora pubera TaxID=906938 RepID=A0AAV8FF38_9POAL|nr:Triphosphate tunel metalloenzyme 3 [Rhynchospora pubera]